MQPLGRSSHGTRVALAFALVLSSLAASSVSGCGGAQPQAEAPQPPRPLGELTRLLPLESTFVVVARPAELFADPAMARVLGAILPSEQLDRFAARSGVDPRALDELVIAEHPEGRVVLARGPIDAPFAVREAGARMAPIEASVDDPLVRRVGFLGPRRVDLSALSPEAVAWIEGSPQLAAEVLAATDGASAARRLFQREEGGARHSASSAPLACYALDPLGLPLDTGIGLLLARQRTLTAWVHPTETGALRIGVELEGEFPEGASENFRALARSIADSDLGRALGVPDALPTLRIAAESESVRAVAELNADTLAFGLRTLLSAELVELLEEPSSAPR